MHGFSTVDGFVEITESLAEMIKYVANEPSVGLFYIQQHTQNAVPNLVNLKNNVVEKSHETSLHSEDLEDSVIMARSMKQCGFSIADDMIRDIRKSLAVMSTKQAKKGLIQKPTLSFQTARTSSWGSVAWGRSSVHDQQDDGQNSSYFSNVFKTARQKASNLKWPQLDSKDSTMAQGEKLLQYPTPPLSVASASTSSSRPDMEADELPVSSQLADELHEQEEEGKEEEDTNISVSSHNLSSQSENYDDFKADKEAKLEEWLEGTNGNPENIKTVSGT
ncbi:MEF2BNB-like protein [Melia azedarach]|uniref:MEF2BNB-like protein n=2 Tax=Melia azedarach TaxID=155640 RepID=A0ACC1YBA9_MELAZ|nr:MEF2BNB-like protein [Melia azedarach]KAJ4720722.1 MEF2BNB-like protein [Melia azedarach]